MLWLYESFFPVIWDRLSHLLADQSRRYQNHPASRASRLGHSAPSRHPDRSRPPLDDSHPSSLAIHPALAGWLLAFLARSRGHRRRPSFRHLGSRASRQELEQFRYHQGGSRANHQRSLCHGPSPHLHRHSHRILGHCDCALAGARVNRFHPNFSRTLAQAPQGGAVDAIPVWGDVHHLRPKDGLPGTLPFLIGRRDLA